MKFRFPAALLLAALSILILSGCAAQAAAPTPTQPVLTVIEEPAVPLAPVAEIPIPTAPAPTEAPAASTEPARITKEEAAAIALKDAGFTADQVTRLHVEFDWDDGRPEYDVDFRQGGYEYDYEIHAETGKILSRDKEWDD